MHLASDNTSGIAPEILEAIAAANQGSAAPYGEDPWTRAAEERFREVFETELQLYPVATGTAANALALASLAPPYGAILCHPKSHINVHQCAAPEFFTGGAKLLPVAGPHGKVDAAALRLFLDQREPDDVHQAQPTVLSLTQSIDFGAVYQAEELAELCALAHRHGLRVHVDGARFANAVVAAGASPAELSWRAGVDMLSFGATKNGALAAEAILVFDRDLGRDLAIRRKRGGQLFSKMRFLSAQLEAYLGDGLWLRLASGANSRAARLAQALEELPEVRLLHPVESNMLWLELPRAWVSPLAAEGYPMLTWKVRDRPDRVRSRWVTAWNTSAEEVEELVSKLSALGRPA